MGADGYFEHGSSSVAHDNHATVDHCANANYADITTLLRLPFAVRQPTAGTCGDVNTAHCHTIAVIIIIIVGM